MMTPAEQLQEFQRLDKYSRWLYSVGRRETWSETTWRYQNQMERLVDDRLDMSLMLEMQSELFNLNAIGSMRTLAMSGLAFDRDNITGYNCAALSVDSLTAFHDLSILGMAGCGVSYSVEHRHIDQLPVVSPFQSAARGLPFVVPDNAEGWAKAFYECIRAAYEGIPFRPDFHLIRDVGAVLRIKGGRASGPEPLRDALGKIYKLIRNAAGRQLTSLEVSDVCCFIAQAVVSGGVRRTALMGVFDFGDRLMIEAKHGDWFADNPQRANANLTQVIEDELSHREWQHVLSQMFMYGEPGFFNRHAAINRLSSLRVSRLDVWQISNIMPNPCGETLLIPEQLCNLAAFIARHGDTAKTLIHRARVAARMGTIQAAATFFPNLMSPKWAENCERERLIGVGFGGYMDTPTLRDLATLRTLYDEIVMENHRIADALEINHASAYTAVKPMGNSGLLIGCSSGIHARLYPYHLRRVTLDDHSPMYQLLKESGVPLEKKRGDNTQHMALFPMKAPDGAVTLKTHNAKAQMQELSKVTEHYADQGVSVTVSYRPGEQSQIVSFVHANQDSLVGCTFFPAEGDWEQKPITEITRAEYERRAADFPQIQWAMLRELESADYTQAAQTIACGGGTCEFGEGAPPVNEVFFG
jgi:ribonucleoside-triphosphate reductase (thioredoxin)